MKKRYDYFWAKAAVKIIGFVFFSQLILEICGVIKRKPGLEWVVPAFGAAFILAAAWSVALIIINALNSD